MTLEAKDTQNLRVHAISQPSGTTIRISGLAFHSAFAVKDYETKTEEKALLLNIHLVRARKGFSGSFDFSVPLPQGVEKVLLGAKRVEIWPTRTHQGNRTP